MTAVPESSHIRSAPSKVAVPVKVFRIGIPIVPNVRATHRSSPARTVEAGRARMAPWGSWPPDPRSKAGWAEPVIPEPSPQRSPGVPGKSPPFDHVLPGLTISRVLPAEMRLPDPRIWTAPTPAGAPVRFSMVSIHCPARSRSRYLRSPWHDSGFWETSLFRRMRRYQTSGS